jgi:hypothetical protein
MSRSEKSRAELLAEVSLLRRWRGSGAFASVVNNIVRWGGLVCIVYWIYRSVDALAGNVTTASIGLNIVGDVRLSDIFGYLFGGSGIAYGLSQRHLRRRTIYQLQARIKELEAHIDPRRTSSGLTTRGATHPRDL